MTIERFGLIKFAGKDVTVLGPDMMVGQKAPGFIVQAQDWSIFNALQATKVKVRILCSLPSLSTSVCDRETRRFNQEASNLDEKIVILTVSMDLPYTLRNWCAASGVDRVITLSDHKTAEFGKKYGVLIKEYRVFRRAIFVIDQNNLIIYTAYMPAIGDEPSYPEVLDAAKHAL
jgi:thiol peroxidase